MKYFGTIVIEFEDDNLERAATRISEMAEWATEGLAGAYGDSSARIVTTSASAFPMIAMTGARIETLQELLNVVEGSSKGNVIAVNLREMLAEATR